LQPLATSFVLGFHGCDRSVADKLVEGEAFNPSRNDYDWLGPGAYFWEANPQRGIDFARELQTLRRGPKVESPAVVGAVIDLGLCLDVTTTAGIRQIRDAHADLSKVAEAAGQPLPSNSSDSLRRKLDCAVVTYLHQVRGARNLAAIDTLRGIFVEGDPVYAGSGFHDKTHVQICVCNPNSIKGVFRVHPRFLDQTE
jgi:hypothetical protein